jgi:hypothetical protein
MHRRLSWACDRVVRFLENPREIKGLVLRTAHTYRAVLRVSGMSQGPLIAIQLRSRNPINYSGPTVEWLPSLLKAMRKNVAAIRKVASIVPLKVPETLETPPRRLR